MISRAFSPAPPAPSPLTERGSRVCAGRRFPPLRQRRGGKGGEGGKNGDTHDEIEPKRCTLIREVGRRGERTAGKGDDLIFEALIKLRVQVAPIVGGSTDDFMIIALLNRLFRATPAVPRFAPPPRG